MTNALKTQYEVEILKTGDGALRAAKELQSVQAEADKARARLRAMSAEGLAVWQREADRAQVSTMSASLSLGKLESSSSKLHEAIRGLGASARIVGFTIFPEATAAAEGLKVGYEAVRNSAAALGVGMSRLLGPVAAIGTTVYAGVEYWRAYRAGLEATTLSVQAYVRSAELQLSLHDRLKALEKTGLIEPGRMARLKAAAQPQMGTEIDADETWMEKISRWVYGGERRKIAVGESDAHYQARIHRATMEALSDQQFVERAKFGAGLAKQAEGVVDTFQAGGLTGEEARVHAVNAAYQQARAELQALGKQGAVVTGKLTELDAAYADQLREIHEDKLANQQEEAMQEINASAERIDRERAEADQLRSFQAQLTADSLSDEDRVKFANLHTFEERMRHIQELSLQERISGQEELDLIKAAGAAYEQQNAQIERQKKAQSDLGRMQLEAAQQFSAGFSNAFLDFVSGTKSAEDAFKQFASSFLRAIAEMIMQMLILRALKSAFGFGAAEGGTFFAAQGGMFPRMMAMGGIQTVGQPTYFPRFNVVAGEAGPEMLTVLSRPRMMQVGGVEAAVGHAGPQRLAITDATALERRAGGGGAAEIVIRLSPGVEADITRNSIEGARIRVVRDMREDSDLSQATRKLVS